MDAQQRLLLEACWEALGASALSATNQLGAAPAAARAVGVAVGISYNEYYLNSSHQGLTVYSATSGSLSVVCGRISFALGLKVVAVRCCMWEACVQRFCGKSVHPQTSRTTCMVPGVSFGLVSH